MLPLNTILEGKALEELLEREANKHEISIIDKLSQFGPNELFHCLSHSISSFLLKTNDLQN